MPNTHTFPLPQCNPRVNAATGEFQSLQRHVRQCFRANGAWHSVRCKAETVDSFVGGRVVSMVVVAGSLLAASAYW